jgi:hypothetical protein
MDRHRLESKLVLSQILFSSEAQGNKQGDRKGEIMDKHGSEQGHNAEVA